MILKVSKIGETPILNFVFPYKIRAALTLLSGPSGETARFKIIELGAMTFYFQPIRRIKAISS